MMNDMTRKSISQLSVILHDGSRHSCKTISEAIDMVIKDNEEQRR